MLSCNRFLTIGSRFKSPTVLIMETLLLTNKEQSNKKLIICPDTDIHGAQQHEYIMSKDDHS